MVTQFKQDAVMMRSRSGDQSHLDNRIAMPNVLGTSTNEITATNSTLGAQDHARSSGTYIIVCQISPALSALYAISDGFLTRRMGSKTLLSVS